MSAAAGNGWELLKVEVVVAHYPGITTDELIARGTCGDGDDGPPREPMERFIRSRLDELAESCVLFERNGRWYRSDDAVLSAFREEDDVLTPQEVQRRTGLTQKQTVQAIDHVERDRYDGIAVDWSGWIVDDPRGALTEILGEGWEETRREYRIASPLD